MKLRTRLMAGTILVGMLLSGTEVAWAGPAAERDALRGQVVGVDGNALLIETPSGQERSVIVLDETRLYVPGVREPTVADVDLGDYVAVWGDVSEDGDLLARVLVVIPQELARRRFVVQGLVSAVDGFTITVETPGGERIVTTGGETRFVIPRVEEPTIEDVLPGDPILALGKPVDDQSLAARVVAIVTPRQVRRHTIRGVITAIEGDSFTLLARPREVQVLMDEETIFRIPGVEDPGPGDLKIRDVVMVVGTWDAQEELFRARAVTLIPSWPSRVRFLRGEVTGIEGRTVVLDASQGEVAVLTDGDTVFRIAGVEDPGLDDVRVGDKAALLVVRTEEGGLLARVVLVRRTEATLRTRTITPAGVKRR